MHLSTLELTRFRSFPSETVPFHRYLTVLVGENNGGKSSLVDGLRLITTPLNGRRERYCEDTDLLFGSADKTFELKATFTGLNVAQKGLLISAVPDPTKDEAVVGLTYSATDGRGRPTAWAARKGLAPEPGALDAIHHVFLPALRDAQRALASGDGRRISALLTHFLGDQDPNAFAKTLARHAEHNVISNINTQVGVVLAELTGGFREQSAALGFGTENLIDIARDLRFRLGDAGVDPSELAASGLGYANLLFITTVVLELERARKNDLTLFLVEEPEAHLHPQLQMLVLDLLRERAEKSAKQKDPTGGPEGRIQVVATTHSPNLTAWVPPEHLVVLRSQAVAAGKHRRTACVPIAQLGLDARLLAKISRYLDVTRAALLFGGRVLLVEGIAEAILVPVLAKRMLDRKQWKKFQGTTLIAIDGVDFRPFVELLLKSSPSGVRISDRVVVLTDRDPHLAGNRANDLKRLAETLNAADCFNVFTNAVTLERDIYSAANRDILRMTYLDLHPRSADKWTEAVDGADDDVGKANAFHELFKDVRKGDFAQALADRIERGEAFSSPAYLEEAIRAVIR